MRYARKLIRFFVTIVVSTAVASTTFAAELSASVKDELARSQHVYISTTRKDGKLGKPAEIWFMYRNGAVYVASPPTTWRVRRIKAGRRDAKIAVGKPDGPSFTATGAVVSEPDAQAAMLETYGKKYPDRWPGFEQKFRDGFKDGSRVLIKYTPKDG